MTKKTITSQRAPAAIGPYSQAVRLGSTVYFSGQIALHPDTMELVDSDLRAQLKRVFTNLSELAKAAGGTLDDIVKLNIYLVDLSNFSIVNECMAEHFDKPYPARSTVEVSRLPKDAEVEIDAIMQWSG